MYLKGQDIPPAMVKSKRFSSKFEAETCDYNYEFYSMLLREFPTGEWRDPEIGYYFVNLKFMIIYEIANDARVYREVDYNGWHLLDAEFELAQKYMANYSPPNFTVANLKKQRKYERDLLTSRLRREIMQRDGYRCVHCGRAKGDVKLTVDHIVPISLGGRTVPENLQTLCRTCNLRKSNKFVG
jgi:5-methylcytosine-specific restriction endonuclease McrA